MIIANRSLAGLKLQAAFQAAKTVPLEEISEIPLATEQTKRYMAPLICSRTGITVGSLATITVAGHGPMLGQWRDTMILHPFFSLNPVALLQVARNGWLRFCALSAEEAADQELIKKQEQFLQVAALAMLHNLTEVKQDIIWMPSWHDVASNWTSLMSICYWRAYLDSDRFKFPSIRLSKLERDINLKAFLQTCFDRKKAYEKNIIELADQEKAELAEKIMKQQIDAVAGKKPLSPKILWRWFCAHMPPRYKKDLDGWMWELFTADESTVLEYTMRDIELFEEIVVTNVELGSTISHAFLEVVRSKHKLLRQHFETYEILIPETIAEQVATGEISVSEEPKLKDFPSKVKWMIAHSKWKLAQPSARKHQEAEAQRQQQVSVRASHIPDFKSLLDRAVPPNEDDLVDDEDNLDSNFGGL